MQDPLNSVTLATRLPAEVAASVRANAAAADRTVSAELRRAVRYYLKNDERRALEPGAVQETRRRARLDKP